MKLTPRGKDWVVGSRGRRGKEEGSVIWKGEKFTRYFKEVLHIPSQCPQEFLMKIYIAL